MSKNKIIDHMCLTSWKVNGEGGRKFRKKTFAWCYLPSCIPRFFCLCGAASHLPSLGGVAFSLSFGGSACIPSFSWGCVSPLFCWVALLGLFHLQVVLRFPSPFAWCCLLSLLRSEIVLDIWAELVEVAELAELVELVELAEGSASSKQTSKQAGKQVCPPVDGFERLRR